MIPRKLIVVVVVAFSITACAFIQPSRSLAADETPAVGKVDRKQLQFFEMQVRPLLAGRCFRCHSAKQQKGGLRLDSRANIVKGGESGPAIEPGKPNESLLMEAVRRQSLEMPPNEELTPSEIQTLARWIEMGAPWPSLPPPRESTADDPFTTEDRAMWSFQPLRDSTPPEVEDANWRQNPIDRFVFSKLKTAGLAPLPNADKRALLRRVCLDLTGLPPSPTQIEEFLADSSPMAYEKLVDRLLGGPAYGERWARHWLDLVRYAESDGFKADHYRPHAWRYRDYVIDAFNRDKPLDRFVVEQLAGDEIAPHDPQSLIATGFLRLGIYEYNQRDVRTHWSDILNEITDVVGDVFLGLGVGCARCHDHKFDPILQTDYYRLRAFFEPLLWRDDVPAASPQQIRQRQAAWEKWSRQTAQLRRRLAEIEQPYLGRMAKAAIDKFPPDIQGMIRTDSHARRPLERQLADIAYRQVIYEHKNAKMSEKIKGKKKETWKKLQAELARFDHLKPPPLPAALTVSDVGDSAPPTRIPGDSTQTDIPPGFLTILDPAPAQVQKPPSPSGSTGRRSALARWLVEPGHPLTARVMVNRVWQYHFGVGLVATSSDFGRLGEAPSHRRLLDWLAIRLINDTWSIKRLHRRILLSATYQQSALEQSPEVAARARLRDPQNRLLWRMNPRRLDAEQIRDAALFVSGELDQRAGGPAVKLSRRRRTIYAKALRNTRDPLLDVFDSPGGIESTAIRNRTVTPAQALLMINDQWMIQRAQRFAKRVMRRSSRSVEGVVDRAYLLAYARPPRLDEQVQAAAFLQRRTSGEPKSSPGGVDFTALVDFCHVLLNSNEFLYID